MPRAEEFQAHVPTVTCASIGRKSMGVIVTGGDDKLVNLWTIGRETRTLVRSHIDAAMLRTSLAG